MKILRRFSVIRKLLVISFLLLTAAIAAAQVQLEKKSNILPAQKNFKVLVPQFEFNTQTGDTLIVWIDWGSPNRKDKIVGRIVNASGKTVGKPFTIVTLVENPLNSPNLSLAYNPVTNEFLLAYNDRPNNAGYDVYLLRLKPDGRPIGKAIEITSSDPSTANQEHEPTDLVFNPKTGGYFLSVSFGFYAFVTSSGTLNGPLREIKAGLGPLLPRDFALLPSSGKLLVLAHEYTPYSQPIIEYGDYSLANVDPSKLKDLQVGDFVKINVNRVLNPAPDQNRSTFRLLAQSLSFSSPDSPIVYYTDNQSVKGRKINASGELSSPPFVAFNSPVKREQLLFSSAAFSTISGNVRGMLIAVEDEGIDGAASVWAQALNENGKPVGTPQRLYTTGENEKIVDGGEIIALPVKPGESVARFVYYGLLQKRGDFNQSLQWYGVGSQILKLNISLNVQ